MPTKILYDDFEDNSEDGTKWAYSGTHAETGGRQRVGKSGGAGSTGDADSNGKNPDNIGWEWTQTWDAGGSEGPDVYARILDSVLGGQVEARSQHAVNTTVIKGTGAFGGSYTCSGKTCTIKVIQEAGVIKVYVDGTFRFNAYAGVFSDPAPHFNNHSEGGTGTNFNNQVHECYYYPPEGGGGFVAMLD